MAAKTTKKDKSTELVATDNREVIKAVETIAVNPRSGKLTLLTRKLFNVLLYHAQEQGLDSNTYRLPLSEICSTAQFDSNDTALVKEHLRKMNACQVEWSTTGKNGRKWDVGNLIASATIMEEGGSKATIVEWSYAPNIKERILKPDVYTRISLQFQSAIRSSAALALFEVCKRYESNPGGVTMREKWEWFRPRLTGVPDGQEESHSEYKYFKRDVLKPSITEVNQVTHLFVELIEHKVGRKVVDIQFRVSVKQQATLALADKNLFDMSLLARIMAFGIQQVDAENLYANNEENLIRSTIDMTEKRIRQKGAEPLASPAAYFRQALRQHWAKKPGDVSDARKLASPESKKPKATKEAAMDKLKAHRREEAKNYFAELEQTAKEVLYRKFETSALEQESTQVRTSWKKNKEANKLAGNAFYAWLSLDTWGEPTESDLLEFVLSNQG